jgi:citrate lyase beta subunit
MKWSLNYIAITNQPQEVLILEKCGVGQVMVDAEILGKVDRQKGRNTIISDHKIEDVRNLKLLNLNIEIICRINPFHQKIFEEIDQAIDVGADYIMLPMIKCIDDYKLIVDYVDKRIKIIPLIETTYSLFNLKEIIEYSYIKQIHFGLNDLFIDIGYKNLFELILSNFFSHFILILKLIFVIPLHFQMHHLLHKLFYPIMFQMLLF